MVKTTDGALEVFQVAASWEDGASKISLENCASRIG